MYFFGYIFIMWREKTLIPKMPEKKEPDPQYQALGTGTYRYMLEMW